MEPAERRRLLRDRRADAVVVAAWLWVTMWVFLFLIAATTQVGVARTQWLQYLTAPFTLSALSIVAVYRGRLGLAAVLYGLPVVPHLLPLNLILVWIAMRARRRLSGDDNPFAGLRDPSPGRPVSFRPCRGVRSAHRWPATGSAQDELSSSSDRRSNLLGS